MMMIAMMMMIEQGMMWDCLVSFLEDKQMMTTTRPNLVPTTIPLIVAAMMAILGSLPCSSSVEIQPREETDQDL